MISVYVVLKKDGCKLLYNINTFLLLKMLFKTANKLYSSILRVFVCAFNSKSQQKNKLGSSICSEEIGLVSQRISDRTRPSTQTSGLSVLCFFCCNLSSCVFYSLPYQLFNAVEQISSVLALEKCVSSQLSLLVFIGSTINSETWPNSLLLSSIDYLLNA